MARRPSVLPQRGPIISAGAYTAAAPLTKVGDTSGAGTTFTTTRVTDVAAWDLSTIAVDMVAKTSGGWVGRIRAVSDASDYIDVFHWEQESRGDPRIAAKPADGETVTIHRVHKCKRLRVWSRSTSGGDGYIGPNTSPTASNSVILSKDPTHTNSFLLMEASADDAGRSMWLDMTNWYAASASGTLNLVWCCE